MKGPPFPASSPNQKCTDRDLLKCMEVFGIYGEIKSQWQPDFILMIHVPSVGKNLFPQQNLCSLEQSKRGQ